MVIHIVFMCLYILFKIDLTKRSYLYEFISLGLRQRDLHWGHQEISHQLLLWGRTEGIGWVLLCMALECWD